MHEVALPECKKCSLTQRERNMTVSGFCRITKGSDALGVKCVGNWGREKVFTVSQYLGIFADAIKGKFDHINYLEICSGPGRCVTRNGLEIDGTPLVVLRHWAISRFSSAVFVDVDEESVAILNQRIARINPAVPACACVGDYNDLTSIDAAIDKLNLSGRTLTLCVLDPYDCSMPFDVIRHIKQRVGKCDFIISYFDGLDAKRNLRTAIKNDNKDELSRFARFIGFGDREMSAFLDSPKVKNALLQAGTAELMGLVSECYEANLKKIGLTFCADRPVRKDIDSGVEFYRLLFASADELGLKFWREIGKRTSTGQTQFVFMEA